MEKEQDNCKIKRWDLLKAHLNNLGPEKARDFIATHPDCTIIDCRRPEEFEMLRLPNAVNIDYLAYDFWQRIEQLPSNKTYLIYCNTCRRSTRSCTLMQNGGFSSVYNLDGGLQAWVTTLGDDGIIRLS
jgi:rhodanese-related sulfurtransferase